MDHRIPPPIGGSPALSAVVAALPLAVLLVLLGGFRVRSDLAAAGSLLAALAVAVLAFRLPVVTAVSGTAQGAAFGVFPIVWIMVNALWVNRLLAASGLLSVVRDTFAGVSPDHRVQALVLAFCFGSVLEALAGFGAPVVVIAAILLALGLTPIRAATVAMFADAAGTAFGSMGNPIVALSRAANLPAAELGRMVGRQAAIVAVFMPFVILLVLDGRRGLRELWPVGLVAGLGFATGQVVTSNFIAFPLSDLIGALLATLAAAVLLWRWSPAEPATPPGSGPGPGARAVEAPTRHPLATRVRAFVPYLVLVVLLAAVSVHGPAARFATGLGVRFSWPGVPVSGVNGTPPGLHVFRFDWLSATGTVLLVTGLLSLPVLRLPVRTALREYGAAAARTRRAAVTVVLVLGLAYLMNYSGQAVAIGAWLAGAGGAFVLLSPALGWLGVAATGSDTSANALFGAVQVAAAGRIGVSPVLLAATNSEAGVLGKLVSTQNLAMVAAVVGMAGREGTLFRRTFPWSAGCLAGFTVLVYLMAYGPLSWMVP
ncbi:L-lactate permease [Actinoallomurus sp. CA-142502]|uniref:L-lactate permease n=1 Tax=Actinoallomurus sp. CA-142502 TaxID=3239885 RepID=UPI003D8B7256